MRKAKRKRRPSGPRTYFGKKVLDAAQPMHLVVNAGECERGKANDPHACAAALAIKRQVPGAIDAVVNRCITLVVRRGDVVRFRTPHALRDQLLIFDNSKKFEPGSYRLLAMPPSLIRARGKQHSPPDRPRGDPNSPKRRKSLRVLGRPNFHFTKDDAAAE